jgi:NADH-quinone oxidoreductase subunit L
MEIAALIALLAPLAGLLLALPFYLRGSKLVHWPILASCIAATAASLALAYQVSNGGSLDRTIYRWMGSAELSVDFGLRIDFLSASVLWMVCLVSTLIHVYAVGYMKEDPSYGRFFLYFHFFFFSMVGLLTAHNYLQRYMFWEGVGLASFLLIGFW